MEQRVEELRQKQKKLTFALGDKIRRLYKSQGVRFLYTSEGVEDEEGVNKLIRLLDYLDERIEKFEEIYGQADDQADGEVEEAGELEQIQEERFSEAEEEEGAGSITRPQITAALDEGPREKESTLDSICRSARLESDAEERLFKKSLERMQKGTEREREVAVGHIAGITDKDALRKVYAFAMKDASSLVRLAVVRQVARTQDADNDELLLFGLKDTDIQVKIAALKGVGSWVSGRHQDFLGEVLKDGDEHARGLAVTYLGIYYGKDGVKKACAASTDQSPYVRKSLIDMLAIVKPEGALSTIKNLLSDNDKAVVSAAELALAKLMPSKIRREGHGKSKK